jgi:predicted nucleic acid-binding protein
MTYLVDANVISEPTKQAPSSKVIDWLSAKERNLVVDSIILGELYIAILAIPGGRKRLQLERWFEAACRPSIAFLGMRQSLGVGPFWW